MMIKSFLKKRQHILFPVLDISLNGVNYFFHVYVSWYLSGSDYGKLNALLSVSAILFVLGISFQLTTARKTAVSGDAGIVLKSISANGAGVLLVVMIALILLSPIAVSLTRSSFSSVALVVLIFMINLILSIFRGIMQGLKRFFVLNISFYIEVISKIILLILFMSHFKSINITLASILAGMTISLFHSFFTFRGIVGKVFEKPIIQFNRKTLTFIGAVGISQFALYFFTSVDMIIVNYFLTDKSGVYAVVLKYNQLLFFVSFSIMTVFIPHLSECILDKKKFLKLSFLNIIILSGIGIVALVFYRFILPQTVSVFFGEKYEDAAQFLFLGGISYFLLIFSFMLINTMLVLDKKKYIPVLIIISLMVPGLLFFFHHTIKQVIYVNIFAYSLLLLILIYQFFITIRKGWQNVN